MKYTRRYSYAKFETFFSATRYSPSMSRLTLHCRSRLQTIVRLTGSKTAGDLKPRNS